MPQLFFDLPSLDQRIGFLSFIEMVQEKIIVPAVLTFAHDDHALRKPNLWSSRQFGPHLAPEEGRILGLGIDRRKRSAVFVVDRDRGDARTFLSDDLEDLIDKVAIRRGPVAKLYLE